MSNKDMTERTVLAEQFPQCRLRICLFHTLPTMRFLQKSLAYHKEKGVCAWKFSDIRKLYDELMNAPQKVVAYFNSNCHSIRHEWVDGLKNASCNFMNCTNNRVESINQKLKSVITRYSGITQFFQDLMKCLTTLRVERDHTALEITTK